MAWRYRLEASHEIVAGELAAVSFANRWLTIRDGMLCIAAGYAWDGCSPTFQLPGRIWLGPWDGPLMADGRPASWQASLAHDALCQFRSEIQGLSKDATVELFARMLREACAPGWMCQLYPAAVWHFGPQEWGGLLPA